MRSVPPKLIMVTGVGSFGLLDDAEMVEVELGGLDDGVIVYVEPSERVYSVSV